MKDELQGKLVEILTNIQTAAGKASDFAMEQLPDIAQSYVVYGRAHESVWMLAALAVALSGWRFCAWTSKTKRWEDLGPIPVLPLVLGVVALLISSEGFLLVWFAPKVWLLKEIASLLK